MLDNINIELEFLVAEFHIGPSSEGLLISVELKKLNDRYRVLYFHPDERIQNYEFADLKFSMVGYIDSAFDDKEEAIKYIIKKYKPVHTIRYDQE